jgi:flagellum-specific peptidoglycan hydrolase FlgJ
MAQTQFTYPQASLSHLWILKLLKVMGKYWFQLFLIFLGLHFFFNKEISVNVQVQSKGMAPMETSHPVSYTERSFGKIPMSTLAAAGFGAGKSQEKEVLAKRTEGNWKSSDFSNLSFVLHPNMAVKRGVDPSIVEEKLENCRRYVERFAKVALAEKKKYGIPVSITLAQGLLETNAGASSLSTESNNHFGIKCKPKCIGCTCKNYADDDQYDMFRVFDTAWESFRAHSLLLNNDRYRHLKKNEMTDYQAWARGLKKAGYATDPHYADKLIQIIEALDLDQFDRA